MVRALILPHQLLPGCAAAGAPRTGPVDIPLPGEPIDVRIRDGQASILTENDKLVVVDPETRAVRTLDIAGDVRHHFVEQGTAWIANRQAVVAVDLASMKVKRTYPLPEAIWVAVASNTILATTVQKIHIIDVESGREWTTLEKEGIPEGLEIVGEYAYLAYRYPGILDQIHLRTRKRVYSQPTRDWLGSLRVVGDRAYCRGLNEGGYTVFELKTGEEVQSVRPPGKMCDFDANYAYGIEDGHVVVSKLASQAVVRKIPAPGAESVVVEGGWICALSKNSARFVR